MTNDANAINALAATARAIAEADSPANLFKLLVDAGALAAPRAAVYLIRNGEVRGWGSHGYDADQTRAQRAFRAPAGQGWLGRLVGSDTGPIPRGTHEDDPEFGQLVPDEVAGHVVRIDGKPIALLVAERSGEQEPWAPEALELFAGIARLRLELNLALRRLARQAGASAPAEPQAPAASEPTVAAEPPDAPQATEPTAEPDHAPPLVLEDIPPQASAQGAPVEIAEIVPAAEPQRDPALEAARRFARLVATDIRLYNEEDVVLGRRNGDLADRLNTHLGRGKETFLRRHANLGSTGLELLHEAYVQVLAGGDATLIPSGAID